MQRGQAVFERSEIQKGRRRFLHRRQQRKARVVDGRDQQAFYG
jgi:hypothetical protein